MRGGTTFHFVTGGIAVRPVVLGRGENLLEGIDMRELGYETVRHLAGERALHVFLRKR